MRIKQRRLIAAVALILALAACDNTSALPTSTPAPAPPTQTSPPATLAAATPDSGSTSPPAAYAPTATSPPVEPPTATSAPPTMPDTPTAAIPATAPPLSGGGKGEGEEGGVEEALVTYRDAGQRFSVGYPGSWTRDSGVTEGVKFDGGDDSMRLEFITLPQGTTVMAYAEQDVAAVSAAFPGFQQVGLAASTEVAKAVVLGFEAQGTSTVTGKVYAARSDRYYIPLSDGRLAVLTVVGPKSHYDREGVRDIALTLQVIK